jgi:glutamyl/glutaminyl-tRNA synthetase
MKWFHPITYRKKIKDRVNQIIENISQDFSIETISKSPARFDQKKLNWFNTQYIQKLDLIEFITRSHYLQINKISDQTKKYLLENELNYREGVYVCIYDEEMEEILVHDFSKLDKSKITESKYFLIGGGVENGEMQIQTATREIYEEVGLRIEEEKLRYLDSIFIPVPESFRNDHQVWYGKLHNYYIYNLTKDEKEKILLTNQYKSERLKFVRIHDRAFSSKLFSFWVWIDVSTSNGAKKAKIDTQNLKIFLACKHDQNRATTLLDIGVESNKILNYQKPELNLLKWRKNTLEESLETLSFYKENILNTEFLKNILKSELSTYPQFNNLQNEFDKIESLVDLDGFYWSFLQEIYEEKEQKAVELYLKIVEAFDKTVKEILVNENKDFGLYLWPIRISISGQEKSPSIFELIPIIGFVESFKRICDIDLR